MGIMDKLFKRKGKGITWDNLREFEDSEIKTFADEQWRTCCENIRDYRRLINIECDNIKRGAGRPANSLIGLTRIGRNMVSMQSDNSACRYAYEMGRKIAEFEKEAEEQGRKDLEAAYKDFEERQKEEEEEKNRKKKEEDIKRKRKAEEEKRRQQQSEENKNKDKESHRNDKQQEGGRESHGDDHKQGETGDDHKQQNQEEERKKQSEKNEKQESKKETPVQKNEKDETDKESHLIDKSDEISFEEKRAKAIEEVGKFVGNTTSNISLIFSSTVGQQYLDDPAIVCAIVEKYPQSIKRIPNETVAMNLDAVTESFIKGTNDICQNLQEARQEERFYGGAGPSYKNYDSNGHSLGNYYEDRDIQSTMQDIGGVYSEKMNDMCQEAASIIAQQKENGNPRYKDVNPSKLGVGYFAISDVLPRPVQEQFESGVGKNKDQARTAANAILDNQNHM